MDRNSLLNNLKKCILEGDDELAAQAAEDALGDGADPTHILEIVANAGDYLGERYERGDIFLPGLFIGADAMTAAVDAVLPAFEIAQCEYKGIVVIGTVEGDVHDLGKRIVTAMLVGAGFKVHDLGVDVPAQEFVEKALELNANIIAASAILTTTARRLSEVGEILDTRGLRSKIKYMIGGASINNDMVEWAGADAYGETAFRAVVVTRKLMSDLGSEK